MKSVSLLTNHYHEMSQYIPHQARGRAWTLGWRAVDSGRKEGSENPALFENFNLMVCRCCEPKSLNTAYPKKGVQPTRFFSLIMYFAVSPIHSETSSFIKWSMKMGAGDPQAAFDLGKISADILAGNIMVGTTCFLYKTCTRKKASQIFYEHLTL